MDIRCVQSPEDVATCADLANIIWRAHYIPLIGQAQVDYMIARFQSREAISRQIADGVLYYLAVEDTGAAIGYFALIVDNAAATCMISKIYLLDHVRGQGKGRTMLNFIESFCTKNKLDTLWLTVNRHNTDSIAFYKQIGFTNAGSIVQDIGAGFVMDDFKMVKSLIADSERAPQNIR